MPCTRSNPWRLPIALGLATVASSQSGWLSLTPASSPSSRTRHGMAYEPTLGITLLFGGATWSTTTPLADTWVWNGTNWSQRTHPNSPSPRSGHGLTPWLGQGKFVLFGGQDAAVNGTDETWEYDGVGWTQRQPVHAPAARRQARITYEPTTSQILLFGGFTGGIGIDLGDTWRWDGNDWTQLVPPTSPTARSNHGLTYDLLHRRVVLWGGRGNGVPFHNDTWIWNGLTWSHVITSSSPPATEALGIAHDLTRDLVVLVGGSQTWLFDGSSWRADPRPGGPPPRGWAGVTHDLLRQRTILFGGGSILPPWLNDSWEYAPGAVASWEPFGSGCGGTVGLPLLRPNGTSLPILGTTFTLELVGLPATGTAAIAFGLSASQWGSQPLPMDLRAPGMPGCTLHISPDSVFWVPIAAGYAAIGVRLPSTTSLVGMQFWNQGFATDPGANPAGAVVTNAGAGQVGPF